MSTILKSPNSCGIMMEIKLKKTQILLKLELKRTEIIVVSINMMAVIWFYLLHWHLDSATVTMVGITMYSIVAPFVIA